MENLWRKKKEEMNNNGFHCASICAEQFLRLYQNMYPLPKNTLFMEHAYAVVYQGILSLFNAHASVQEAILKYGQQRSFTKN